MKNSKYIKVSVSDRLPDKYGKTGVIDNKGEFKTTEFLGTTNEEIFRVKYDYWLEEKPDYEDEMKEMLEECVLQLEHLNSFKERGTTNSVLSRLETLITKLKTESCEK